MFWNRSNYFNLGLNTFFRPKKLTGSQEMKQCSITNEFFIYFTNQRFDLIKKYNFQCLNGAMHIYVIRFLFSTTQPVEHGLSTQVKYIEKQIVITLNNLLDCKTLILLTRRSQTRTPSNNLALYLELTILNCTISNNKKKNRK